MWYRDAYTPQEPYVEQHFKLNTSGIIPGKPKVHPRFVYRLYRASFWSKELIYEICINFQLPSNVAKQDINTFVS